MARICTNANPCLHTQQCLETGDVSCQCSSEYSGDGCEIAVDYCSGDVCMNGGDCISSLTGYICKCKNGYQGTNCKVNPDNCNGVTCPGGATCVDGEDKYFCRCPLGKVGSNCSKDVDTDNDLLFSSPMKDGMAAFPYPIPINLKQFSVSLWVRFWDKDDMGNFLTIFFTESQGNTEVKSKFLSLDSAGLKIMNGINEESYSSKYIKNNDGKWHNIVVTWNGETGILRYVIDSLSDGQIENFSTGKILNTNLWVVLGAKYNPTTKMAIKDEGFRGWISQVNIYNRELDFQKEIPLFLGAPMRIFDNTIQRWSGYQLMSGVWRIPYSIVKHPKISCPRGYTDPVLCDTKIPSKTEVKVEKCPSDIIILGEKRITQVKWENPTFIDSSQVISNYVSESQFLWGKYHIIYQAMSDAGSNALCAFDLFVQYDNCMKPEDPKNGSQIYNSPSGKIHHTASVLKCNMGFEMVQPTPELYTCGPIGSWDPLRRFNTFVFPPCGEEKNQPEQSATIKLVFKINTDNCEAVKLSLPDLIRSRFVALNPKYGNKLCTKADCSDIVVVINCAEVGRRRKRQISDLTALITLPLVPSTLTVQGGGTITPEELINQIVLGGNELNFEQQIPGAKPDPNALEITIVNACSPGQTVINNQCVECSAGTFYNASTQECNSCPMNMYQPEQGANSCVNCDGGKVTENVRSTAKSDCKPQCNAGEFYESTKNQCSKCPQGFYQMETGQFYCDPCPVDKTTRNLGATSKEQCFNDCPIGTELTGDGSCVDCVVGKYRSADDLKCMPCQTGTVTPGNKSTSVLQCTLGDCREGYKRVAGSTDCVACDIGLYQDQIYQMECITCGGSLYRTDQKASKKLSDCKFFCPDGQEQVNNQISCVDCEIGFYRNSSENFYDICTPCQAGFRTPSKKSVTDAQCTIYKCIAGEKPEGQTCVKCPRGSYQPLAAQEVCINCTGANSTRDIGSTSLRQCETYCESGFEKNATSSSCDPCPIGYFKDNSIDIFSDCTVCPAENITSAIGSKTMSDCNVKNCSAGYKLENNECVICPIGFYQDHKWKTSCIKCETDKTTESPGADSKDLCILNCNPGFEDVEGTCSKCKIGFYKDTQAAEKCKPCDDGKMTLNNGATSKSDCNIAACPPGERRDEPTNVCVKCDYGTYQPEKWKSSCISCPTTPEITTTYIKGATDMSKCWLDCNAGSEYVAGNPSKCEKCPIGEYRDKLDKERFDCLQCPINKITPNTGSTTVSACTVANCSTPGQFLDINTNTCNLCPVGQYQDTKWKTSCIPCTLGQTTDLRGSSSINDCKTDCLAGKEYNSATSQCEPCPIGEYRDKLNKAMLTCQKCPDNLSTFNTGAINVAECSKAPCQAGQFYNRNIKICEDCANNFYQPKANQFECILCQNGKFTVNKKSMSSDECLSKCANQAWNDCHKDSTCSDDASSNIGYRCTCKEDYEGDGKNCTHKCDLGFCGQYGTCLRDSSPVTCTCDEAYSGNQCQSRKDASVSGPKTIETIIIATVTTLAILLFIILLVVCICVRARRRHQKRKPFLHEFDDRGSYGTGNGRMSVRNYDPYGSKAPSIGGQRLMLPTNIEKIYDNPVYRADDDPAIYRA